MRLTRRLSLIAVATLLGLSGCASADRSADLAGEMGFVESMPGMAVEESMPMDSSVGSGVVAERSQIITGDIYLTVDSPNEAAQQVTDIVTAVGGRVDSITENTDPLGGRPSAYLWVRIPVQALDQAVPAIEALGVVESKTLNNVDVTLQVVDLDARIQVLEDAIARLDELLLSAETTAEVIEIETALSERQAELDSLNSQRTYLSDQIQYASLGVDLRTSEEAPEREAGSFLDGIIAGWQSILAFFAGTVVFFGFVLPWLGLLILVALVITAVVWIRRRRRSTPGNS